MVRRKPAKSNNNELPDNLNKKLILTDDPTLMKILDTAQKTLWEDRDIRVEHPIGILTIVAEFIKASIDQAFIDGKEAKLPFDFKATEVGDLFNLRVGYSAENVPGCSTDGRIEPQLRIETGKYMTDLFEDRLRK